MNISKNFSLLLIPVVTIAWLVTLIELTPVGYFSDFGPGRDFLGPIFISFFILVFLNARLLYSRIQLHLKNDESNKNLRFIRIFFYGAVTAFSLLVLFLLTSQDRLIAYMPPVVLGTVLVIAGIILAYFFLASIAMIGWLLFQGMYLTFQKVRKQMEISPFLLLGILLFSVSLSILLVVVLGLAIESYSL